MGRTREISVSGRISTANKNSKGNEYDSNYDKMIFDEAVLTEFYYSSGEHTPQKPVKASRFSQASSFVEFNLF